MKKIILLALLSFAVCSCSCGAKSSSPDSCPYKSGKSCSCGKCGKEGCSKCAAEKGKCGANKTQSTCSGK